jgi:hypothetical protein
MAYARPAFSFLPVKVTVAVMTDGDFFLETYSADDYLSIPEETRHEPKPLKPAVAPPSIIRKDHRGRLKLIHFFTHGSQIFACTPESIEDGTPEPRSADEYCMASRWRE